jgi:hypothetical protein
MYLTAPLRWLFRSRRRLLTAAAILLAMIEASVVWWTIQLMGLPDIGEPFDVETFRSLSIPDDRNAFVLYRRAMDRFVSMKLSPDWSDEGALFALPLSSGTLVSLPSGGSPEVKIDLLAPWSKSDARVRRWAEQNREALALYRRGTERPDALEPVPLFGPEYNKVMQALRGFHLLALLEVSRLEEQGEMAGAWAWYRSALRATHHMSLRSLEFRRFIADRWRGELNGRLTSWSANPRTTAAMVRQALDDAIACGALVPSDSYTLMAEYPYVERTLDSPWNPGRQVPGNGSYALFGSPEYQLTPEQLQAVYDLWRSWRREPERSRRVIRLAVANWLAYYDLAPDRRPPADPKVTGSVDFYSFGPEAPAKARALSPESLDRWLESSVDARESLKQCDLRGIRTKERASHRALIVLLASQLYRRDHGSDPPSDEALVGPYLKELPDDGLGEAPPVRGPTGQESSR